MHSRTFLCASAIENKWSQALFELDSDELLRPGMEHLLTLDNGLMQPVPGCVAQFRRGLNIDMGDKHQRLRFQIDEHLDHFRLPVWEDGVRIRAPPDAWACPGASHR